MYAKVPQANGNFFLQYDIVDIQGCSDLAVKIPTAVYANTTDYTFSNRLFSR